MYVNQMFVNPLRQQSSSPVPPAAVDLEATPGESGTDYQSLMQSQAAEETFNI